MKKVFKKNKDRIYKIDGRASNGGFRKGSGAKPNPDKKITVTFYIRKSVLENFGGKSAFIEFVNIQISA